MKYEFDNFDFDKINNTCPWFWLSVFEMSLLLMHCRKTFTTSRSFTTSRKTTSEQTSQLLRLATIEDGKSNVADEIWK